MKYKKLIYILCAASFVVWTGYRIYSINSESRRIVFNAEREFVKNGEPVEIMEMVRKTDFLYEPLVVKNNKAFVSGVRINKFGNGQKIDNGTIIYVSKNLDIDTGMYIVKTSGLTDGLHFAKIVYSGFFVPIDAVSDNTVMVSENGIAVKRAIKIIDKDSKNVLIYDGLSDGDKVILSPVIQGRKVK